MDQELIKSLTSLIDETITEIEDLKKSRYSDTGVEFGKEESIAGFSANGEIEDAEKAEGKNSEADPGTRGVTEPAMCSDAPKSNLHAEATKAEDEECDDEDEDEKKKKKEEMDKAEGKNREAAPGTPGKVDDAGADAPKSNLEAEAKKTDDMGYPSGSIKKSLEEQESLLKSYVDERFSALESKLASILDAVEEMGEAPVERRGVPSGIVPMAKSVEEVETLSKSETVGKLLDLKKSGTYVDSADIAMVEMGGDLQAIVEKYSLN